jgi:stage III sporulation protein SpoIIIAA
MINQNIIALIGNPNTGKTSVLINLPDLINKGIIRESRLKKLVFCKLPNNVKGNILTWNLQSKCSSIDENVVIELL